MATQQEVIKAFMKALDVHTFKRSNFKSDAAFTTKLLDSAVKACSSFGGVQKVINAMLADRKKAGNVDTFLKNYCGINLSNKDTGAITGKDAGGSKIKTASSIVPESGTLDESFNENSFTVNGLTVKLGQDEGTGTVSRSFKSLSKQERYIWRSLHSYWVKSGLNLISESYGDNFSFKKEQSSAGTDKPATKTLYITFDQTSKYSGLTYYADDWNAFGRQKPTKGLSIGISMHYFDKATGEDGTNPKLYSLDRLVAHELTHAVMKANIDYYDYLPAFIKEGMAELTIGIDDENASGIKAMAANTDYLKKALSLTDYSTIKISGVQDPTYAAGYILLRYLAKQAANGGAYAYNQSVIGNSGKDSINNFISGSTIQALGGNDTIRNYASGVTIDSGAGNNRIINEGSNVSIRGGNSADYIYNDSLASNVFIFAGSGADSIFNHAPKVTINGGNDADYISNFNNNVSIFGGAGNDSLYNSSVGSSVTLEGGNDADYISNQAKKVLIRGGTGNDSISNYGSQVTIDASNDDDRIYNEGSKTKIFAGAGVDSIFNHGQKVTIDGGNDADYIYNASVASSSSIFAGSGNDSIFNHGQKVTINGGIGDDTIKNWGANVTICGGDGADNIINWGGAASLVGGNGNDVIWGDAGKDTILGGANNDKLHGEGGNDKLYGDAGNDSFWGGKGNDSLWGGKGKDTFIYTANEGNDRIKDYSFSEGDMLKILKADGSSGGTFSNSTLSGSNLTLTISDGGSVIFEGFSKGDKFNINGTAYTINNKGKLVK